MSDMISKALKIVYIALFVKKILQANLNSKIFFPNFWTVLKTINPHHQVFTAVNVPTWKSPTNFLSQWYSVTETDGDGKSESPDKAFIIVLNRVRKG